ncbi:MAG: Crp/Fnr family transcriptional regulator [Nitrospinales bacterium]
MENETIVNLMKNIPFFNQLTQQEMEDLASLDSNVMRFAPSEFIIREGDFEFIVYILLKGVVRVVKTVPKEVTITKLKTGAIFGELSWVGKRARTTSVIADGDVIALRLDVESIDKFGLVLAKKIQDKLMNILVTRLEKMNEQLSRLAR